MTKSTIKILEIRGLGTEEYPRLWGAVDEILKFTMKMAEIPYGLTTGITGVMARAVDEILASASQNKQKRKPGIDR